MWYRLCFIPVPKVASKGGEGGRTAKDLNAPKRSLSAFFLFCAEERPRLKAFDPNLSFVETGKELGKRWAAADPAIKNKFSDQSAKDKERYEREKAAYARKAK